MASTVADFIPEIRLTSTGQAGRHVNADLENIVRSINALIRRGDRNKAVVDEIVDSPEGFPGGVTASVGPLSTLQFVNGLAQSAINYPGTSAQTVRYDPVLTNWVSDSFLKNYGTEAAGGVVIGNPSAGSVIADVPFQVHGSGVAGLPYLMYGYDPATTHPVSTAVENGSGRIEIGVAGAVNDFATGAAVGDGVLRIMGGAVRRLLLATNPTGGAATGTVVGALDQVGVIIGGAGTPSGKLEIDVGTTTQIGLYLKGIAAQSADYINVVDSSGNRRLTLDANGTTRVYGTTAGLAARRSVGSGAVTIARYEGTSGVPAYPAQNATVGQLFFQLGNSDVGTFQAVADITVVPTDATPSNTNAGGYMALRATTAASATMDEFLRGHSVAAGDARVAINGTAVATSTLQVVGSFATKTTAVSAGGGYTVLIGDSTILCTYDGVTQITVNLPPAANHAGRIITVKKMDANANGVVIDGNGAETIDGAATVTLAAQYNFRQIQSNGSNWVVIGS